MSLKSLPVLRACDVELSNPHIGKSLPLMSTERWSLAPIPIRVTINFLSGVFGVFCVSIQASCNTLVHLTRKLFIYFYPYQTAA